MHIAVLIITLISFLISVVYNTNMYYNNIALLPLSLFIFSLFEKRLFVNLRRTYVYFIFYTQAIARYCIIPIGVSFGDYLGNGSQSKNGDTAIIFMLIELLLILFLFIFQNRKFKHVKKSTNLILVANNYWLYLFLFVMFVIILASGFFAKVNTIWSLNEYVLRVAVYGEEIESSSIGGLLFNPFKIAIVLIFSSLIIKSNSLNKNYKVFFLLLLMGLASTFIVGMSRFSIVMFILPFYFLLADVFNKRTKRVISIALVTILSSVILISSISKFTRGNNEIGIENIINTSSLNAYFAGPGNIAAGIDAFEDNTDKKYGFILINDLFQNVPLVSKITNDKYKSSIIFNRTIYGHNLYKDQIVPLSIAGIFHFDYFGVGLYGILFLSIAFYFERKGKKEVYMPYKYVYFSVMLTLSLVFMLNIGSMIASPFRTFIFTLLPFYISSKLNNKRLI